MESEIAELVLWLRQSDRKAGLENWFQEHHIYLSLQKSFLSHPSVQLLGQRVGALGLATIVEKLRAIAAPRFTRQLQQLDQYLWRPKSCIPSLCM